MRHKFLAILTISSLFFATGCIKQIDKTFTGPTVIEFDASVLNSNTSPYSYHVAVRTPPFGIPTTTANSTAITRALATPVRLRVNLVGRQRRTAETLTYRVVTDGITPNSPNLLAVQGTHFTTSGTFTIPADSSFGVVEVNIVNPGSASTNPREVHLELIGNDNIKPSENYKRVGIRINQN